MRIVAVLLIAIACGLVYAGIYAFKNVDTTWAKYVLMIVASLFALISALMGISMILISFSMLNRWKSVRDKNTTGGIADVRLCDKCGRVISKGAKICEHCGEKQESGMGMKSCPKCKAKNSAKASYCEQCGYDFNSVSEV